MSKIKIKFVQ